MNEVTFVLALLAVIIYEPIRIVAMEVRDNPRYPYKPPIPLTVVVNWNAGAKK